MVMVMRMEIGTTRKDKARMERFIYRPLTLVEMDREAASKEAETRETRIAKLFASITLLTPSTC